MLGLRNVVLKKKRFWIQHSEKKFSFVATGEENRITISPVGKNCWNFWQLLQMRWLKRRQSRRIYLLKTWAKIWCWVSEYLRKWNSYRFFLLFECVLAYLQKPKLDRIFINFLHADPTSLYVSSSMRLKKKEKKENTEKLLLEESMKKHEDSMRGD